MSDDPRRSDFDEAGEFARVAAAPQQGFLREYWAFIRRGTSGWLVPALIFLLVAGVLVVVGGNSMAPFIYALF